MSLGTFQIIPGLDLDVPHGGLGEHPLQGGLAVAAPHGGLGNVAPHYGLLGHVLGDAGLLLDLVVLESFFQLRRIVVVNGVILHLFPHPVVDVNGVQVPHLVLTDSALCPHRSSCQCYGPPPSS